MRDEHALHSIPESDENDGQNARSEKAGLVPDQGSPGGEEDRALSPELKDLSGKALEYHESALSENTREAYQRGWEDFVSFCESHGLEAAPASERAVALYLSGPGREPGHLDLIVANGRDHTCPRRTRPRKPDPLEGGPKRHARHPARVGPAAGAGPAASHRAH